MALNDTINRLLTRNVAQVIDFSHLERALRSRKKLRVKLGIDPTLPELHLGHAVVLDKLKAFQDLGHAVVFIIGDFTAEIGDPSGKSKTRPALTRKEVHSNMKQYLAQAGKIVDIKKTEVLYNSSWFLKEGVPRIMELARAATIQQVLKRQDFKNRIDNNQDVTILEAFYSLLQGYDSVKVCADVEIGGTDQLLNILMGRKMQRYFGMGEQDVLVTDLLIGLDGVNKMSKSLGNYIALSDTADDMFGKVMSIPDTLVSAYFMMCTDLDAREIGSLSKKMHPRELKARLGAEIVGRYYGEKIAKRAEEKFNAVFAKKETPGDVPELRIPRKSISLVELVVSTKIPKSKSEARRLIAQGAVALDGLVKKDEKESLALKGGEALKVGKRHFFRIVL